MPIDPSDLPYRPCVGAMILNREGRVWIGRRYDAPVAVLPAGTPPNPEGRGSWWQMPQGGIDTGEDPAIAVLREVQEETGMTSLAMIAALPGTHLYDLPQRLLEQKVWGGRYRGQRQQWFVLRFSGNEGEINIGSPAGPAPEFDAWRWAERTELLDLIVPFKRDVYRAVLADAERLGVV
jgi:putative (di)nucleoside polyphosphate hydrolase